MNDTSSRNGKYFDIDEILIEEEVNNIVFVLDLTQSCPILIMKMMMIFFFFF